MVLLSPLAGNLKISIFDFSSFIKGFITIGIQINFFGIQGIMQLKNFSDNSVQRKLIYVTLDERLNPKLDWTRME